MAYAALVSLSQILAEHVTDADQQQIKSLQEKLCFLQSFMEDFIGEKVDPLEGRIREATYEAEDIIELHILNRVRAERSSVFKHGSQMRNLEKKSTKDVMRVNGKIDSIVEEAMKIKGSYENETLVARRSLGAGSCRQAPIGHRSTPVGVHNDLLAIKTRLCGESPKLQIISIVGMGGIGKTTLARTVFDDPLIAESFDVCVWTTISQEYCMPDILVGLANSLNPSNKCSTDAQYLARWIYQRLKLRRYLIVMDDMWSTKAWDELRRVLPDDNNGSRVIITSRLSEMGTYADSSTPPHRMQLLNEDQSWSLLQRHVFAQERCPPKLENIGKTIAANCGGLPLAIILVSGLLSKIVRTVVQWEKFEFTVSSTLTTVDEHLFNIFSLSYNNLPHHLRACFLYIGGFPEDHEIPISKLTMLWTAEGFLKPITSKSSEEVAEESVMDLVQRNLISVTKKSSNGRFRLCRIHDLLRDFCIKKAHDEKFLYIKKNGNAPQEDLHNSRRLCDFIYRSVPIKKNSSFIRSLRFSNNHRYLTSLSVSSRLLRVLDGSKTYINFIPAEVTGLVHLRYLAFSRHPYVHFLIPERILKLRNLQTLMIGPQYRYSTSLHFLDEPKIHLPPEIWKMLNLRHLILNNCCFSPVPFTNIDGKVSVLKDLQTLSRVANFSFGKETIEMIPNLKKLGAIYLVEGARPVIKWSKYHLNNLVHLHQLESLNLSCNVINALHRSLHSPFTKNFALPQMLKKLTLTGCRLSWKNLSMIGRLPNLEVLKLRNTVFEGKHWKSTEGEFVRLKYLLMEYLNVKCWRVEYTDFPSLEHLIIKHCWDLKEIPSEIGDIPTLQYIEVTSGLNSTGDSALRIQEEQQSLGNDCLQVRVLDQ